MTIADHLSPGESSTSRPVGPCRTQWVDAAKGVTILLVVLHHCLGALNDADLSLGAWLPADEVLTGVRMPLFFLLAGLFAGPVVGGSPGRLWRERVGKFSYLFLLWTLLHFAFFIAGALVMRQSVPAEIQMRISRLTGAVSPMWFLIALAIFFAVARLARRVSRIGQVAVAGAAAVLLLSADIDGLIGKFWLLAFFLTGSLYGIEIRQIVAPIDRLAGVAVLRPLRWIGTHTLPIYLIHVPAMSIIWVSPPLLAALSAASFAAPIILVSIVVGASLLTHRATIGVPGLYTLPTFRSPRSVKIVR